MAMRIHPIRFRGCLARIRMAAIGNDAVDRVKNTSPMSRPGCPFVGFVAMSKTTELAKSKT
jgi:hypothetical protein